MLIFNPLAWERKDVVEFSVQMPENVKAGVAVTDAENHSLPMQVISSDTATNTVHLLVEPRAVPALGYALLRIEPGQRDATTDLSAHDLTLENSLLRVVVDPSNGCITSLYDKRASFETHRTRRVRERIDRVRRQAEGLRRVEY